MKYLVTGGCGFIGHHLVKRLKSLGHTVYNIDNLSTSSNENFADYFFKVDISNYQELSNVFDSIGQIDGVFHLAALARVQPSIKDPLNYNNVNVNGTLNLLDLSHKNKVKKFVFSSSSSVYGNNDIPFVETMENLVPLSPYGLQKLIGEQYCRLYNEIYGLNTYCLRYFNVYGPNMPLKGQYRTALSIFKEKILNNEPIPITNDGTQTRDFTHVFDVVEANILCSQLNCDFQIFNVGNGKSISMNEIVKLIDKQYTFIGNVNEPKNTLSDSSKLKDYTGWKPTGNIESFLKEFF
jgi:nucleoside-diphosphate-sugar epimerase